MLCIRRSVRTEGDSMEKQGVIYILTNPSFPEYVKIGYADDVERRLFQLNRTECTPFAFRVYATYDVPTRLSDKKLHDLIDKLNPSLRSIDNVDGQKRVREFYAMSAEDAYSILEAIAEIHGFEDRLRRIEPNQKERSEEETAEEISEERRERRAPFAFSMCNIEIGSELEFYSDRYTSTGIKCIVVDDKHVEYEGRKTSLSALAADLSGKSPVQGPCYFKYNGEWLNTLRERYENTQ